MIKKMIFLTSLIVISSCQKEEVQPELESEVDCNCDRVYNVQSFNIPSSSSPNGYITTGNFTTVNDCTGLNQNHSFTGAENMPTEGECL